MTHCINGLSLNVRPHLNRLRNPKDMERNPKKKPKEPLNESVSKLYKKTLQLLKRLNINQSTMTRLAKVHQSITLSKELMIRLLLTPSLTKCMKTLTVIKKQSASCQKSSRTLPKMLRDSREHQAD